MKIDCQEYLELVEQTNKLVTFDIEASGLKGDYNSILCASFKPYGQEPYTIQVSQHGNDQKVAREIKDELEKYNCWVSYYGKGFDIKFINTRLLKWGLTPVKSKPHIDLYFTLKSNTLMSRRSMAQYAGLLNTHDGKMGVSPNVWSEMGFKMKEHMPIMINRCEKARRLGLCIAFS